MKDPFKGAREHWSQESTTISSSQQGTVFVPSEKWDSG